MFNYLTYTLFVVHVTQRFYLSIGQLSRFVLAKCAIYQPIRLKALSFRSTLG